MRATVVGGRRSAGGTVAAAAAVALVVGACAGKPLPIPTPPPSSAGPSATVSASVTASQDPGSPVDAFRSLVTSPSASFRVALTGDVLATVSDLTIKGTIAVAGPNVETNTAYSFPDGSKYTVDTRYVGGKLWVRTKGPGATGKWTVAKNTSAAVDPFAGAEAPAAITDFGPKTVKGKELRELQVRGGRFLDPFTIPAYNLSEERVTSALLTVDVDDAGHPVSGRWKQSGQGRVSGQLQEVDVDVDVTFSGIGSKITITAP